MHYIGRTQILPEILTCRISKPITTGNLYANYSQVVSLLTKGKPRDPGFFLLASLLFCFSNRPASFILIISLHRITITICHLRTCCFFDISDVYAVLVQQKQRLEVFADVVRSDVSVEDQSGYNPDTEVD